MIGFGIPGDLRICPAVQAGKIFLDPLVLVGAHVLVIDEVGRGRKVKRYRVGICYFQVNAVGTNGAALGLCLQTPLVANLALDAEVICRFAGNGEAVLPDRVHTKIVRAVVRMCLIADAAKVGGKGYRTGLIGGQPDDDHLIGRRCENLTRKPHAVHRVRGRRDGRAKVERAAVIGHVFAVAEEEMQVREALVFLLLDRITHQLAAEEIVRLEIPLGENEPLDLGQEFITALHNGRIRPAGPVCFLVELNTLFLNAAKDHPAQTAVADRYRLVPFGRGNSEPNII